MKATKGLVQTVRRTGLNLIQIVYEFKERTGLNPVQIRWSRVLFYFFIFFSDLPGSNTVLICSFFYLLCFLNILIVYSIFFC